VNEDRRCFARWRLVSWLLVVLYVTGIFVFSQMSSPPIPRRLQTSYGTLFLHFLEFGGFALLLFCALFRTFPSWSLRRIVVVTILTTTLLAASDEFHQSFVPGRHADVKDLLVDSLGGTLAALTMGIVRARRWSQSSAKNGSSSGILG